MVSGPRRPGRWSSSGSGLGWISGHRPWISCSSISGKAGSYFYWAARAIDDRSVRADRIRKSVGAENTFPADLFTLEAARDQLRDIIEKIWAHCDRSGTRGRTVTLKVKFANFRQITRSRTGQLPIGTRGELEQLSIALLEPLFPVTKGIRLLGLSVSSLAVEEPEGQRKISSLSL
jgi:DNA polymerase IV